MKTHFLSAVFLAAVLSGQHLRAQQTAAPAPVPEPEWRVISRTVIRKMATEPAPLPGMVPVTKERTVTIEKVADPHLPEPPPVVVPDPNDPEVIARRAAFRAAARAAYKPAQVISLSATTYDFTLTRLVWRSKERPNEEITAWSNIPFEYIRGFGDYVIKDKKYMLFLGYGVETTLNRKRLAARLNIPYVPPLPPPLPDLAADGPAFVVVKGDATGTPELEFLTGLHEIFPTEAPRLKAAYEAREAARIAHEAYVRAHPPEPQDIHLRVWEIEGEPYTAK